MLTTIENKSNALSRVSTALDTAALSVYCQVQGLKARLVHPVNLRSRRGAGDMIWTIITVGLVAAVAATSIFLFGPKILQMGADANTKLSAPPW
ncbi:MAG: hypothetical protein HC853_14295 [Anaerolineae bacterium]|nr:hypothetical protein [Anaerolineae bacterium]